MTAPKLLILKRMQHIQGKMRPCCFVRAIVSPALQAVLDEHFSGEALFKRSAYSMNWPAGAIQVPAALAPAMGQLLKNDACPEITVKTMLAGQMHQAANVWEMMSFELVAKLSFDNFLALCETAASLDREVTYSGYAAADKALFDADTVAELHALRDDSIAA